MDGELRTIDFFDPDTGDMMHQLSEPNINKIMSLNRFNMDGSALLSTAGLDAYIWKVKPEDLEEEEIKYKGSSVDGLWVESWPGYKPQPKSRPKKKKQEGEEEPKKLVRTMQTMGGGKYRK